MALPYPTKVVLPFDIATAQDMNERHANDVALANGSGLNDGAVTPAKRTGGFYIGIIPGATLGSTGNKSITGVGFTPRCVTFTALATSSTSRISYGAGAMTSSAQYCVSFLSTTTAASRNQSTSACIGYIATTGSDSFSLLASYVSMDADGFTINVTSAISSFDVAYEAYA